MIGTFSSRNAIVTNGSRNPFADLGFENPELELAKSKLVMEMAKVIDKRHVQARAGAIIGLPQPKLSQLRNGRKSYGLDRLTGYLAIWTNSEARCAPPLRGTRRPGNKVTWWCP